MNEESTLPPQTKTEKELAALIESVPGGIFSYSADDAEQFSYLSETMLKLLGYTRAEFLEKFEKRFSRMVWHEDRERVLYEIADQIRRGDTDHCEYRIETKSGALRWFYDAGRIIQDEAGKAWFYVVVIDITERKEAETALAAEKARADAIIRAIPGGVGVFRIQNNEIAKSLYLSDGLCALGGRTKEEYSALVEKNPLMAVYPEDRRLLMEEIKKAESGTGDVDFVYRSLMENGRFHWVKITAHRMSRDEEGSVYSAVFIDVDEIKQEEFDAVAQHQKLNLALEGSDIYVWEYDPVRGEVLHQATGGGHAGVPEQLLRSQNLEEHSALHPDSVKVCAALHEKIHNGAPSAEADLQFVEPDGTFGWRRVKYLTLFDDAGRPVRAVGCATNLAPAKELEARYNAELAYQSAIKSELLLVMTRANLTTNLVEQHDIAAACVPEIYENATFSGMVERIAQQIPDAAQRRRWVEGMRVEKLISQYNAGEKTFQLEYRRKLADDSLIWVSTAVKLLRNPATNHLLCFCYTHNINEEKISRELIAEVANIDYDYLIGLDAAHNSYLMIPSGNGTPLPARVCNDYESELVSYARQYVVAEDCERVIREMMLENVLAGLKKAPFYCVDARVREGKKHVAQKRLRYSWMDKKNKTILLTRRDITDIVEKEEMQKEALRDALAAAQQASEAKSEFLSRMSHEIRTPMNAIIGMSAIAAQCIDDPEQVADCLSKVGISARFLLSLINDILDMSRIESGKIYVKQEKIPFEDFVGGINTIAYAQAEAKGVEYDAIIASFTDDYYIGDAMKLQQVLLNLISNAIKFTPAGGKVQFITNAEKQKNGKALLRFTVNDTGVGISEEFMPHLFDPFAQQHVGSTTLYGGTGLGLAISKNLITLMDGNITVNSIEGVGSEFNVEVRLGISEQSRRRAAHELPNFAKLKALIVDDDILVCQHTERILGDMGLSAEWVTSGERAVEAVRSRWDRSEYYDIIIIDWKMPGMNGIETAREVRKIVGPDVTIIIMTAYDWAPIEAEAKKAGVNILVSKPLFRSSLVSTFEKVFQQKQEDAPENLPESFDFSGKRVLLVEDHLLNIEVAKKLLESKSVEVEIAENGLLAIEKFAKAAEGHYQAVLMDIRMPVMDGLTAARAIRQMEHPDAKDVPIIAMTANAFDEDVEKTKAAGMNAHLAKPIEPQLLYRTLKNYML